MKIKRMFIGIIILVSFSCYDALEEVYDQANSSPNYYVFVAVGNNGSKVISKDGILWENISSNDGHYTSVAFRGGTIPCFAAIGPNLSASLSFEGKNWTDYEYSGNTIVYFTSFKFFTATSAYGTFNSPEDVMLVNDGGDAVYGAVTAMNKIVSVGVNTGDTLYAVAYGNNRFVAVGENGRRIISTDGEIWTNEQVGGSTLRGITFGDGVFIAVGDNGRRIVSNDGITWMNEVSEGLALNGIAYGNGIFIAVGDGGRLVRSIDKGLSWSAHYSRSGYSLNGICYGFYKNDIDILNQPPIGGSGLNSGNDTRLQNIAFSTGTLTPLFSSNFFTYYLVIPESITSVSLTPSLLHPEYNLQYKIENSEWHNTSNNVPIMVSNIGINYSTNIVIKTSAEGADVLCYTIFIRRRG